MDHGVVELLIGHRGFGNRVCPLGAVGVEHEVELALKSLGMRPFDVGGLDMAYVVEWAAILLMGLARNGAGFNVALGAEVR
jgi:hypothetical protein